MPRGVGGCGAANVMRHLRGITFPARRSDILDHVREKNGETGYRDTLQVVDYLAYLPEHSFQSVSEIMKEIPVLRALSSKITYNDDQERNKT
jgi:hypothetical protein